MKKDCKKSLNTTLCSKFGCYFNIFTGIPAFSHCESFLEGTAAAQLKIFTPFPYELILFYLKGIVNEL